jgi:hypothetical protein
LHFFSLFRGNESVIPVELSNQFVRAKASVSIFNTSQHWSTLKLGVSKADQQYWYNKIVGCCTKCWPRFEPSKLHMSKVGSEEIGVKTLCSG